MYIKYTGEIHAHEGDIIKCKIIAQGAGKIINYCIAPALFLLKFLLNI